MNTTLKYVKPALSTPAPTPKAVKLPLRMFPRCASLSMKVRIVAATASGSLFRAMFSAAQLYGTPFVSSSENAVAPSGLLWEK